MTVRTLRAFLTCFFAALFAALGFGGIEASSLPPLRILVGSPAGGPPDIAYRSLADRLGHHLQRPVVVINVPGVTLFRELKKAPADGATLAGIFAAQATVMPQYLQGFDYNVVQDFTSIGIWNSGPTLIVASTDSPYHSLADVLRAWREKPNGVPVATQGVPSPGNLYLTQLARLTNTEVLAVPYRAGQAQLALLRGEAQLIVDGPAALLEQIRAGKMRPLAVIGYPTRLPEFPDVPTVQETGLLANTTGLEVETWMGVMAPGGLPDAEIEKVRSAIAKAIAEPDFQREHLSRYRRLGLTSAQEMRNRISRESEIWRPVVHKIGLDKFR
jgi:tripartite-type tricarboxylate transporter receptor subunit TctC